MAASIRSDCISPRKPTKEVDRKCLSHNIDINESSTQKLYSTLIEKKQLPVELFFQVCYFSKNRH